MGIHRILVVSSDGQLGETIAQAFRAAQPQVAVTAADGVADALAHAASGAFDLTVVHAEPSGTTGIIAASLIRRLSPETTVVLMADEVPDELLMAAIRHDLHAVVSASISAAGLVGVARQVLSGARPLEGVMIERPNLAASIFDAVRSIALDGYEVGVNSWPPAEIAQLTQLLETLPRIGTTELAATSPRRGALQRALDRLGMIPTPDMAATAA